MFDKYGVMGYKKNMNKMIIASLCATLYFFLFGCSISYRNESHNQNLAQIEKKSAMVSLKMIKTAGSITLGYLEETENIITNPNSLSGDEKRSIFYVYDKDFNKVGFMTEHGAVSIYQYTQEGNVIQVSISGVYTIEAGSRRLLSYDGEVYYEDFEPAPIWHDNK